MVNTTSSMCDEIITNVRTYIIAMNRDMEDSDPWNELEGGAGWLDNEFDLFNSLYVGKFDENDDPNEEFPPEFDTMNTVEEIRDRLVLQSNTYLTLLKKFTMKGGSSNNRFFELKNNDDGSEESKANIFNYLMDDDVDMQ
jgi:hypothetical protein